MQPALRGTSSSACVDFELGHQLQRCYSSFAKVVLEICAVPAPCAKKATSSRLLCPAVSCWMIAQVLLALPHIILIKQGNTDPLKGWAF